MFVVMLSDEDENHKYIIIISIGKEAVIVYNIRYMPACKRSGWYPQNKIIIKVGISEASNQMQKLISEDDLKARIRISISKVTININDWGCW